LTGSPSERREQAAVSLPDNRVALRRARGGRHHGVHRRQRRPRL